MYGVGVWRLSVVLPPPPPPPLPACLSGLRFPKKTARALDGLEESLNRV